MPRNSIVDEIAETHPLWKIGLEPSDPFYLILYSFGRTPTRFYEALEKLQEYIIFWRSNRGTLITHGINDAYSLMKLIKHYNGETRLYHAKEIDVQEVYDKYQ